MKLMIQKYFSTKLAKINYVRLSYVTFALNDLQCNRHMRIFLISKNRAHTIAMSLYFVLFTQVIIDIEAYTVITKRHHDYRFVCAIRIFVNRPPMNSDSVLL